MWHAQPFGGFQAGVDPAKRFGQPVGKNAHFLGNALGKVLLQPLGCHIPHLKSDLRDRKLLLHGGRDQLGQGGHIAQLQQFHRPTDELVRQGQIVVAVANHFHDAAFEQANFVAQHHGLTFLQIHRPMAVWAAEHDGGQQLSVALKKLRVVQQVLGNIVFGDGV